MKAMIFAAGRGTRLRPLTDAKPKALVEIDGVPLLEIALRRLAAAGVREVIINVHHFAAQIEEFVNRRVDRAVKIQLSREAGLLDTGGGLKQAAWFFDAARPFFVHNVDVLSDVDLGAMLRAHEATGALATLAASARPTLRPLLFDRDGMLAGRVVGERDVWINETRPDAERLGFCGMHVISPALLPRLTETGAFSIIDSYLRLAAEGAPIRAFRADGCRWRDVGRPQDVRPL